MNPHFVYAPFVSIVFAALVAGCTQRGQTEADQHGHAHAPGEQAHDAHPEDALEPTSRTVFGKQLLLFVEHPHLVQGQSARFLVHLTALATGEPVRAGQVSLELGDTKLAADGPKREGLFTPEGSFPVAGRFQAILVVRSDQAEETLALGEVLVHSSPTEARAVAESAAGEEPAGSVPFLMEQQWKVKLLLAEAAPRTLSERLVVPARAVVPEGREAAVSPPVAGRLVASSSRGIARSGERVEAGDVLGFVEPPLSAPDLAQLQALQLEFDLKALDVARAVSEAAARLTFAERERERIAKLREQSLSTQQQLDQAEQNLAVARSEGEAARATKASLDRLQASRAETAGGNHPGARLPLVAPLGGAILSSGYVEGAFVKPEDELFRIMDSSQMWIEGRISEFDLSRVRGAPSATATFAALPGLRIELASDAGGKLPYIGPVIDQVSRTTVIRFELRNGDGAIRAGMLAELAIATTTVEAAVVVPVEAVLMEQGIPTVYVMLEGESFQRREIEVGVKDGAFVEVRSGLAIGEHVATRGAYVVKLAALSPASFGAGHAH